MAKPLNLMMSGNPRYQPRNLKGIFGYDRLYQPLGKVEIATLETMAEIGLIPAEHIALLTREKVRKILAIRTTDVDRIERNITGHDVNAWKQLAMPILGPELSRWLHVPLTSYDGLSTAHSMQFLTAHTLVVQPSVRTVINLMSELVVAHAKQIQIGRTHLQHALPVTIGFWLAGILYRIIFNAKQMDDHAAQLVGKISGAVGAYNAQKALGILERCGDVSFEVRVLSKLGLKPPPISTQIAPPEPLTYYLFACLMLSQALGQFGRDGRTLMSSDLAEVFEAREAEQVGSSTMTGKINPVKFENLEGTAQKNIAEFLKVLLTLISTLQRDLVASSIMRDFPTLVINLQSQLDTLNRKGKDGSPFLSKVRVDPKACRANLRRNARTILGEPLYIALQIHGYEGDAHKLINNVIAPAARAERRFLIDVLKDHARSDDAVAQALGKMPPDMVGLFYRPERYTGLATEKALEIAAMAEAYVGGV